MNVINFLYSAEYMIGVSIVFIIELVLSVILLLYATRAKDKDRIENAKKFLKKIYKPIQLFNIVILILGVIGLILKLINLT